MMNSSMFKNLKSDIPAGLVVFLVSLPLCLGIALASGAPLFSGIIAGIIGGIVVGWISGSSIGVSGPAAGLVVIVLGAIQLLGMEAFMLAVVISGVIQVILGFSRAGIIGYFFPTAVINGMLTAIGITIFLKQIPHLVGYDQDYEGNLSFMQADNQNTFSELINMLDFISIGAVIIGLVTIGIIFLWDTEWMKKQSFTKIIPGGLVVVIAGISINQLFINFYPEYSLTGNHLVQLPVVSSFSDLLKYLTFPDFSQVSNKLVWETAFTIAIIGSLETLLSAEAADKLDVEKRVTPANLELKAQGIGNIISGLIGGLPITQVVVRSSANAQAGGKTKMSTIIHGILLLLSVLLIPMILNLIPLAALGSILFIVGFKLAKPAKFKAMYKLGVYQFIPFITTVVAIVFTDLLIGILVGLAVSAFNILMFNYRTPFLFEEQDRKEQCYRLVLGRIVTFLNKGGILQILNSIPEGSKIRIDASKSVSIDYDIVEVIRDFEVNAHFKGIEVEIINLEPKVPENQFKRIKAHWEEDNLV
jgi:MFS superfamily sulfate permease-like transporter